MESTNSECQIVCIELPAWERLKVKVSRLVSEVAVLKEVYCPNPRDG